jgi:hypothetical protein
MREPMAIRLVTIAVCRGRIAPRPAEPGGNAETDA